MILHQFPDLHWLKKQAEQRFANRRTYDGRVLEHQGWPTVVLHTSVKQTYRDNIRGPLSLFSNLQGDSLVEVEGRKTKVKEGFFFLSNQDQHYTLEINQPQPTETFNIHFGEYFADKVLESLQSTPEKLLDNTFEAPVRPVNFHNRLQPHDITTHKLLLKIKSIGNGDAMQLEETLYHLIAHVLCSEKAIKQQMMQLPVLKSSTRQELFQRLLFATDYIFAFYDQALSLEELARVSCLSKFHFLRLFKIAFQKTPHQFINEVRLNKAKELLKKTSLDVHEVASYAGFQNSSSFSRAFFQHAGAYPTQYRVS